MDTSETYIKMCDCEEIQGPKLKVGLEDEDFYEPRFAQEPIWLPRQDQLQEMVEFPVGTFIDNMWTALSILTNYAFNTTGEFRDFIPMSMEQLWLAFVMKERFSKEWSGEDWL